MLQVDKEISKAEASIERYLAAFEANTIPEAACGDRVRSLADKVTALRQRRNELICTIEDTPALSNDKIDLTEIRRNIADVIGTASDRQSRKAFLQALIAEVRVEAGRTSFPGSGYLFRAGFALWVGWSGRRGSNSRPLPWQGNALPLSYSRSRLASISQALRGPAGAGRASVTAEGGSALLNEGADPFAEIIRLGGGDLELLLAGELRIEVVVEGRRQQ